MPFGADVLSGQQVGKIKISFEGGGDEGNTFVTVVFVRDNGRSFEDYAHEAANGLCRSMRENYRDLADLPPSAMEKAKEYVSDLEAHDGVPRWQREADRVAG